MNAIIFNDALETALTAPISRTALVDAIESGLSIARRCELVGLPRSTHYARKSKPAKQGFAEEEEKAMAIIDKTHADHSSYGARRHMKNLAKHGIRMGRHRVAQLMAHMGIRSTAPQPKTSTPNRQNPKFPYLLRGLAINRPNQVWATDITYLPLGHGHVYLTAVIDWYSRFIVGWRIHDTLEARECVVCMEAAMRTHGEPSLANSDQGSTFTASEYVECLKAHHVRQSMDGKHRWADNVLIERWFRDLKHDCIYLAEYRNLAELKLVVADYVERYNYRRLHSSLDYEVPADWYFSGLNEVNRPDGHPHELSSELAA